MATTTFVSSGLEFVPNNYSAPLSNENAPTAFHLLQSFLAQSPIGHSGTPSIVFEFEEAEYVITPGTVRAAMGFPDLNAYTIDVGEAELLRMMREIGYGGSLAKIGQLKRPFLRKEWSFFFDCITRTFGKKCINWDAIPTESLQIGYSLIYGTSFDYGRLVLSNLGDKMTENRGVVYFSRFCQLLFTTCVAGVEISDEDVIPCFKLHKRIFSDLINKDVKKGVVGELLLPASVQQFVNDQLNPQTQPQPQLQPEPQTLNTEPLPSTSQQPQSGGRIKKRAFKRKVRANRPKSDDEDDADHEVLHHKKRKLVANYLFDNLDEAVPEAVQHEAPAVVVEESTANADIVDRVFLNTEAPEVIVQEATEDDAAATEPEMAQADKEAEVFEQDNLFTDFEIEAHPSINVCDTEDVAADQPTQILDESLATHTEILSVNNTIPEQGEEVDQVIEAAVNNLDEATAEKLNDIVAESIPVETEVLVNSDIPEIAKINANNVDEEFVEAVAENVEEAAQLNTEATTEAANSEHSLHANSNINLEFSNSDESIPFLRDPTAEHIKENVNATEAHYRDMYYANWSGVDCIFSKQRTADFITQSAKEIANSELLSHFKATIVQVKSLHNRFDETHKDQDTIKQRLTNVESNQAELSTKIDSIAASLELLTSVLIPDDVKKGERVSKDKCKRTPTLRLRDDANDGGSRGAEQRSKSSQEQGRLRSNSARQTNSDMINSGATGSGTHAQSSSRLKSLVISANPITDEEIAAKLFLDEHDGEVTVEDLEAEMKMLSEEHRKKVASGNYKKKAVKVPRKKELGISIKENSQQSMQYSRRPTDIISGKGKGKLIEDIVTKKNYSTSDIAQVEYVLNQSTTDKAQVDDSSKVVTTSDVAQVVQTQLSTQLQGFKRPILPETLKPESVNFL
ncbi:hypothetical protein POM88_036341 [Heracleum sosnowskyi]|uniref:Uncharacterized protein n=1 Tax=Heracleum sosnowskyi TaxID=360622 RepID=A0AAD8MEY6_9APIA|nr:hypothetical protein POM88_036341 [Heracleum sosnowskyi]